MSLQAVPVGVYSLDYCQTLKSEYLSWPREADGGPQGRTKDKSMLFPTKKSAILYKSMFFLEIFQPRKK